MYFNRIAATKGEKNDFAIARFGNEAERCLKMLEALEENLKMQSTGEIDLKLSIEVDVVYQWLSSPYAFVFHV